MRRTRLLLLGLDGFELSLAERLMAEGLLPNLRRLRETSARVRLDHGRAKDSGLAWEHVSLGKSPDAARRWSAVSFDPATYQVRQQPTGGTPFPASLGCRTVVFD